MDSREWSGGQCRPGRARQVAACPFMFTTDLALKFDPSYRQIAERFRKDPKQLIWHSPRRGSADASRFGSTHALYRR